VDGVMVYPSDDEAWKHFNRVHIRFSMKLRNVCFGLYTYRFNPFGSFVTLYSCWPVILTIYNLPPRMLMRLKFIILFTIILNPNNPSQNIDICLHSLIILVCFLKLCVCDFYN
jgi:hypothetical protein